MAKVQCLSFNEQQEQVTHTVEIQRRGAIKNYLIEIWTSRYLCWHLAKSDLRNKFRGSFLGLLWCFLQPLALTLLLGFIMGSLFHLDMHEYILFVFSGLIIWELLSGTLLTSCSALINAEAYIKQYKRPLVIYSLRYVLVALITFLFAFAGFFIWDLLANFHKLNSSLVAIFLALPLYLLVLWPIAIVASFVAARFRDFTQLIIIIMQFLWYISPVFFQPKMFTAIKLNYLVDYNPIYHLMYLIRGPMLEGCWPSMTSYIFTMATALIFWLLAAIVVTKNESKIIFYL